MIKPIDVNEIVPFILASDKASESPTIFHIKPMTYRESIKMTGSMKYGKDGQVSFEEMADVRERMFLAKVIKVENWNGQVMESKDQLQQVWEGLTIEAGTELMEAIQNVSVLRGTEIKN